MHDRNGKEIYEYDSVYVEFWDPYGEHGWETDGDIEFYDGSFCVCYDDGYGGLNYYPLDSEFITSIEVTGTICS